MEHPSKKQVLNEMKLRLNLTVSIATDLYLDPNLNPDWDLNPEPRHGRLTHTNPTILSDPFPTGHKPFHPGHSRLISPWNA